MKYVRCLSFAVIIVKKLLLTTTYTISVVCSTLCTHTPPVAVTIYSKPQDRSLELYYSELPI